jgi:hypothetical protein
MAKGNFGWFAFGAFALVKGAPCGDVLPGAEGGPQERRPERF